MSAEEGDFCEVVGERCSYLVSDSTACESHDSVCRADHTWSVVIDYVPANPDEC